MTSIDSEERDMAGLDDPDQSVEVQVSGVQIAVVGPHTPYRGGIAHFTNRVCAELESGGHSVVRVSFSRLYPSLLFPGKTQVEPGTPENWRNQIGNQNGGSGQYDRSAFEGSSGLDSINPISWWNVARKLKTEGIKVVVFMVWLPFFAPAFSFIARNLRKTGVRVVAIVHNALPHERHMGDTFLTGMLLRKCDNIAALSRSVCKDIEDLVPGSKPELIPHPVYDHFGELMPRKEARRRLGLPLEEPILLFFGLVRSYKGLNVLLDALPVVRERLPGLRLVVAGEFYNSKSRYVAQIQRLGIESAVTVIDEYIASERVPSLFGACDVVVQPYISATQSGIVQMAFHFERPVIVTDVGGLSETIGDRGAGFVVPPSDSRALADAITQLFEPGERERLEHGVNIVKKTSSWNKFPEFILAET